MMAVPTDYSPKGDAGLAKLTKDRNRLLMLALVSAEVVSTLESTMVYAALASFYKIFDNPVHVGWLLTGYMLVASASAAICGRLGDLFGRKRVLLIVLAIAAAGSLISAATSNLYWIIGGRALQGLAGAILPLCYGLVREHLPRESVPVSIGIIAATVAGGAGIGFILGGLLVDFGGWRYIFIVSAAVAILAALLVMALVPAGKSFNTGRVDWIGGLLFLPGVTFLLYAVGLIEDQGFGSPAVMLPLFAGCAILVGWMLYERSRPDPLIDIRLVRNPQIGLTLLIVSLLAAGAMNLGQIAMVMLQQPVSTGVGLGIGATLAGTLHAPASLVGVAAGPVSGWLAGRRGSRFSMIFSTAMVAIAWAGLLFAHGSPLLVAFWMFLNGLGMGSAFASIPNLIVEVAPSDRTSEATGLVQIIRKIMMAVGAQTIAVSLATSTIAVPEGGAFPDGDAFMLTYGWVAIVSVLAFLLSLALPRVPPAVAA
jgi:MFS family permease